MKFATFTSGKMIIKATKRIFNSDKICCSYSELNFGVVTFFGTQCISLPRCRIVSPSDGVTDTNLLSVIPHADRMPWPMANFPAISDLAVIE